MATRGLSVLALVTIAVSPVIVHSEPSAAGSPRFHLCDSFVEAATLGQSTRVPEEWFVHVKLTPDGASALPQFTRVHLGEAAQVLVASSLLVEAKVQTIVDSGRIQSSPRPKASAEVLAELLASPPSAPCGAESPAAQQGAAADTAGASSA